MNDIIENCFITGHRPTNKYGTEFMYDFKNKETLKLKEHALIVLEDLIKKGVKNFYTGGALGFDQIIFWCVEILKKKYSFIKNILVLPSKLFNSAWKKKSCQNCCYINNSKPKNECQNCIFKNTQVNFSNMLKRADEIIYIEDTLEYNPKSLKFEKYNDICTLLNQRNKFLVDKGDIGLAYFKYIKGGTNNCINYSYKKNKNLYNLYDDKMITKGI